MKRFSGVLLPVFSLPSRYGIGCFSRAAYDFVDLLAATGQRYWQVLPLNPTGFGDSPYQCFSSFAGNPYFIDPVTLIEEGLLDADDPALAAMDTEVGPIDYGLLYRERLPMLHRAFSRFKVSPAYERFCMKHADWLDSYCLYMTLRTHYGGDFSVFPEALQSVTPAEMDTLIMEHIDEVAFHRFVQYQFFKQWFALKEYANEQGIEIIGDLPIYISMDSAEAWMYHEEYFEFRDHKPTVVAGCPPDAFAPEGQLWGNPVYDWEAMSKNDYHWWYRRFAFALQMFDVLRIDHFRGFDTYYCVEASAETAVRGVWKRGPGLRFFEIMEQRLRRDGLQPRIIAEDLGILTPGVRELLKDTGYPGMRVLQFAFYDRTGEYLPHNHRKQAVVYTGTHDNQTVHGWLSALTSEQMHFLREYMNVFHRAPDHWDIIRMAMASTCHLAIIPFHDYLGLDDSARINTPGTLGENWTWRYRREMVTDDIVDGMRYYTALYQRSTAEENETADRKLSTSSCTSASDVPTDSSEEDGI
ncbi:MAG: 4-alpha-glucanotransferase [Eubacteriales bacterium]|nr:4-alpha-glucanotransferase [Eubacteriales bacterium]